MADFLKQKLNKRPLQLEKVVVELRYEHGFLYLDKCGSMINCIRKAYPEWIIDPSEPNPQAAEMMSLANGSLFRVSGKSAVLSLSVPKGKSIGPTQFGEFLSQCDSVLAMALDLLNVNETVTRIGTRFWFTIPFVAQNDAEDWLRKTGWFAPALTFGPKNGAKLTASSFVGVYENSPQKYRIEIHGMKKKRIVHVGKSAVGINPAELDAEQLAILTANGIPSSSTDVDNFPVQIDIDCSVEPAIEWNTRDFASSQLDFVVEVLQSMSKVGAQS